MNTRLTTSRTSRTEFQIEVGYSPVIYLVFLSRVEPGYNDIGLCDTSSIASYILWYQLTPDC
jgi:hypothetical protein